MLSVLMPLVCLNYLVSFLKAEDQYLDYSKQYSVRNKGNPYYYIGNSFDLISSMPGIVSFEKDKDDLNYAQMIVGGKKVCLQDQKLVLCKNEETPPFFRVKYSPMTYSYKIKASRKKGLISFDSGECLKLNNGKIKVDNCTNDNNYMQWLFDANVGNFNFNSAVSEIGSNVIGSNYGKYNSLNTYGLTGLAPGYNQFIGYTNNNSGITNCGNACYPNYYSGNAFYPLYPSYGYSTNITIPACSSQASNCNYNYKSNITIPACSSQASSCNYHSYSGQQ